MNGSLLERSILQTLAGVASRKKFDALIDRCDCINMEFFFFHGIDDVVSQHKVPLILVRDQNPLCSRKPLNAADVEKSFNFLIHSPDWLNFPILVYRSGNSDILMERDVRETRKDGVNFR